MAMQFNPHTNFLRGMDLNSPVSSQSGINQLLQMQQNTLGGLTDIIGNIGKTSRTSTVNDLIARGGLEGLNEAQAQAKIADIAKGSLTTEGQSQVDKLLQAIGKQDERKFGTGERVGRQDFDASQALLGREFQDKQRDLKELFESGESAKDRKSREKMSAEQLAVQRRGQYDKVQGADGMYYNVTPEGKLIPLVKGQLPYAGQGGGGSRGGSSKDEKIFEITGALKQIYNNSSAKGKLALEKLYETGDLQGVDILGQKNEQGVPQVVGQKIYYKGHPVTVSQLKKQLGLK